MRSMDTQLAKDLNRDIEMFLTKLAEIQKFLTVSMQDNPHFDRATMKQAWLQMEQVAKLARLDRSCPYCGGRGCEACKGTGFVSESVWKMAPKDLK